MSKEKVAIVGNSVKGKLLEGTGMLGKFLDVSFPTDLILRQELSPDIEFIVCLPTIDDPAYCEDKKNTDEVIRANIRVTESVVRFCTNTKRKMLFVSTGSVFPRRIKLKGYFENDVVLSRNFFGMTMMGGEQTVRLTWPEKNFKIIRVSAGNFDHELVASSILYHLVRWDQMPQVLHIGKRTNFFDNNLNVDKAIKLGFPL